MSEVEEKARAAQLRAEAWRARASAFSNVMLGLFYLTAAWFIWKIGSLAYEELSKW